jgi:hypothetical protein
VSNSGIEAGGEEGVTGVAGVQELQNGMRPQAKTVVALDIHCSEKKPLRFLPQRFLCPIGKQPALREGVTGVQELQNGVRPEAKAGLALGIRERFHQ